MSRLLLILDAISNLVIPNDKIKKLSQERAKICADCPLNDLNFCLKCKCYIPLKVLSLRDKCPDAKW